MILTLIVSAVTLGCAAYLALEFATWLVVRDGGVLQGKPATMNLMRTALPTASAVVGGMLASYMVEWSTFAVVGIVCTALAMATWSEVGFNRVPDIVLIVPLVVLLGAAVFAHQWGIVGASMFLAAPFIVLGLMSHGKSIGRTDTELAAVGGAILGLEVGLVAFGVAVLAAFFTNFRGRDAKTQIQLTPYLSSCIVLGLVVRLVLPTLTH